MPNLKMMIDWAALRPRGSLLAREGGAVAHCVAPRPGGGRAEHRLPEVVANNSIDEAGQRHFLKMTADLLCCAIPYSCRHHSMAMAPWPTQASTSV
jgi:hypothetical protein